MMRNFRFASLDGCKQSIHGPRDVIYFPKAVTHRFWTLISKIHFSKCTRRLLSLQVFFSEVFHMRRICWWFAGDLRFAICLRWRVSQIASHSDSGQQRCGRDNNVIITMITMLCSDNLKQCQLASTDLSGNSNNALLLGRGAITQGHKILAFPRIEDGFDPDKDFFWHKVITQPKW